MMLTVVVAGMHNLSYLGIGQRISRVSTLRGERLFPL